MATAYFDLDTQDDAPIAATNFWKAGQTPSLIPAFLYLGLILVKGKWRASWPSGAHI